MKVQCDVCEKAPATVICCADEAALCAKCDVEVHAANKLARKHHRLLLQCLSNKLPKCDICQDKPAFIFCVEDRALFCQHCDEPIHAANSLSANHQRLLATRIQVALSGSCNKDAKMSFFEPPTQNPQLVSTKTSAQQLSRPTSSWSVDELLHFSDFESSDMQKEPLEFGELQWLADVGLLGEQITQGALTAAEVPQLPAPQSSNFTSYRPSKSNTPHKKPRVEIPLEDDELFVVPDLG